MNLKHLFVAAPAALLILGGGVASAGQTIDDLGALACVVVGQRVVHQHLPRWRHDIDHLGEGSHLKEYPYKYTGGTGKYEGASGSGTYTNENLTDSLTGGRYKGQLVLP